MSIRLSGMISGMDTDSIVQGLTSAYQVKIDNVYKKKVKKEWQVEAWESLNTKLYSFYTGNLTKLKTYGNYKTKKATVAGASKSAATVTASSTAAEGTYKMKIKSTASAAFLTGAKLSSEDYQATYSAMNATLFGEMYDSSGAKVNIDGKKLSLTDANGNTFDYTFDAATSSVTDMNAKLSDAGIDVQFAMVDGKLTMKNNTGGEITIASDDDLSAIGISTVDADGNAQSISIASDSEFTAATALSYKVEVDGSDLSKTTKLGDYMASLFTNAQTDDDGKKYISYTLTMGDGTEKTVKMYEDDTMDDFCTKLKEASGDKLNASFDATNRRFFITSKATGAANDFTISADGSTNSETALKALGLVEDASVTGTNKLARQQATDCIVELNGATLTSDTNTLKVDGLGLTINVEAAAKVNMDDIEDNDEEITITVAKDTDTVYNMVKEFVKEYNALVEEMSGLYYAEKTEYEPLTEEEESAMTETQIEKWETKAKSALLRRDSTLNTLMYSMRTILSTPVTAKKSDGTESKMSLASFGICTGEWSEYGKLHIYGDADDEDYSDKTDKLRAAIEEDPDAVMNTLAQVGQKLYERMGDMMKTSELSSTQKLYNDKSMKKQITEYEEEIEKLQEKLESMQERYYDQFSAMEVALSKIQANASAAGLFTNTQ